jgi:hypothetical protein
MNRNIEYELALSFAGEDREYVDQVATLLHQKNIKVFYDLFEEEKLWGKNLYDYLTDIYQNKALYTIMFISQYYAKKLWANHERQAMQSRAFQENSEYILPARFDNTELPGVLPTIGFIDLNKKSPSEFVEIIEKKLVNNGRSIPSEQLRKSMFSVENMSKQDPVNSKIVVSNTNNEFVANANVTLIADNNTYLSSKTDSRGIASFQIHTRRNYKILVAHENYGGVLIEKWDPIDAIKFHCPYPRIQVQ